MIAPELAILGALEAAIDLAIISLVAAQPELHARDGGHEAVSRTSAADSADHVIAQAQALAAAISSYRLGLHDRDDLPV